MTERPAQTFVWSDGKRPSLKRPGSIAAWVAFYVTLRLDFIIIFVNNTKSEGENWNDADLVEATKQAQEAGLGVHWMWWAFSSIRAVEKQLADLRKLYASVIPDGVQFDAEEGWDHSDSEIAAVALNDGLERLNADFDCSPMYSVTAISVYAKRVFSLRVKYLIEQPMITAGFGQAYLFWNGKTKANGKPHWSQGLPKRPGVLQRGVTAAWIPYVEDGTLKVYYLGVAAHFQKWPAKFRLPKYLALENSIQAFREMRGPHGDMIRGWGSWSAKHIRGRTALQSVLIDAIDSYPIVFDLQALLVEAGYWNSPPDGLMSPQLRRRGRHYMVDRGFAPRRESDTEIVGLLKACLYMEVER